MVFGHPDQWLLALPRRLSTKWYDKYWGCHPNLFGIFFTKIVRKFYEIFFIHCDGTYLNFLEAISNFSIVALSIRESILAHCCVSYGNQSFDFLWKSNEAISLWNAIRGWSKLTVTVQAPTPQNDQIIRQFLPTNCLSVFDHFVGLVIKGLKILRMPLRDFASFWF